MIKITVSVTPSLNAMKGKWALTNYNRKYKKQLAGYERFALKEKRKVKMRITRYGSRLLDRDNMIGGTKSILDAIRRTGMIVDDSPKWVHIEYAQEKCKRGLEKTVVEVESQ